MRQIKSQQITHLAFKHTTQDNSRTISESENSHTTKFAHPTDTAVSLTGELSNCQNTIVYALLYADNVSCDAYSTTVETAKLTF
jgi:hypothetical protein